MQCDDVMDQISCPLQRQLGRRSWLSCGGVYLAVLGLSLALPFTSVQAQQVLGAHAVSTTNKSQNSATPAKQARESTTTDTTECFDQAATHHKVNVNILRAIAHLESGNRHQAVNYNANGTRDIGLMQINSIWLPALARYGITEAALFDRCVNVFVGAWILSQAINRHGNTWRAIGTYHSNTPEYNARYAWAVYRQIQKQGVQTAQDEGPRAASRG